MKWCSSRCLFSDIDSMSLTPTSPCTRSWYAEGDFSQNSLHIEGGGWRQLKSFFQTWKWSSLKIILDETGSTQNPHWQIYTWSIWLPGPAHYWSPPGYKYNRTIQTSLLDLSGLLNSSILVLYWPNLPWACSIWAARVIISTGGRKTPSGQGSAPSRHRLTQGENT